MAAPKVTLDSLRREIDTIDDEMHDLLMRRAEVVERVAEVKKRDPGNGFIRPGREMTILRRLMDRHRGALPAAAVVRIWRELLAATTRLQGDLSVAVHAPEKSVGYWDLARDHFGSGTAMTLHRPATPVIRAVVSGEATMGVLSLPMNGDPAPWWPLLVTAGENMPRIVARLPVIQNPGGRFEDLDALVIGQMDQEPTGDDVTLVAVEVNTELSRTKLADDFLAVGLPAGDIAAWHDRERPETRLHLVEIADYVAPGDSRLDRVADGMDDDIVRVVVLGGYPVQLAAPRDASSDENGG